MAAPKAIVLLCDENTASDGELLVHRFQKCGLVSVQA
jgi:C-terminal processing protease CtpA/Prc